MSIQKFSIINLIFFMFFLTNCSVLSKRGCCGHSKNKKGCCSSKWLGKAKVNSVKGNNPKGEVLLKAVKEKKKSVRVTATIKGLPPNKKFGFHIHEFGDCSDKALKAGGHFHPKWFHKKHSKNNPVQHGGLASEQRHLGDLGNLSSDAKGVAQYDEVIHGRVKKFLGRSVVVHAKEDDLKSQPTGNSGDRIACGVIGLSLDDSVKEENKEDRPKKNKEDQPKNSKNKK